MLSKIITDQHFYLCGRRPRNLGFILNLTIVQELRDSSGRHSGGRTPKILFVLSNGGSLTMIKKCCSLWLAFSGFMCASSYFSLLHKLVWKQYCLAEKVTYTVVQTYLPGEKLQPYCFMMYHPVSESVLRRKRRVARSWTGNDFV
jgi:hypothetical protein